MNKKFYLLLSFCLTLLCMSSPAQSLKPDAVPLTAVVNKNPAQIRLYWPKDPATTSYKIYRKTKSSTLWLAAVDSATNMDSTYIDNNVTAGVGYEYRVVCTRTPATTYGYIYAGMELPVVDIRGKLLLVVDTTYMSEFTPEFIRLEQDLRGDGWQVIRHEVSSSTTVDSIKTFITGRYNADPANVKALFLFGNIAVPYAGDLNPDGHPEHKGAWPADLYYGDMTDVWPDVSVNTITAARTENQNIPGDGKFDDSFWIDYVKLQVGRVDLSNMPAFSKSEGQLLKQYLDKDHNFRHKVFTVQERALVEDNFAAMSEKFGANGWRNFSPMFGDTNIVETDFRTSLSAGSYLWAYGSGAGTYTSAGGIGNTTDFTTDSLQVVFTMIFGSYFGDWDNQNNYLRAPLASKGLTLTNAWSGRPHWYFHHMALGDHIGYSTLISQNNIGEYFYGLYPPTTVHVALMGDPSLRLHPVTPPTNVEVFSNNAAGDISIMWTASTETAVIGYHVYHADSLNGLYNRLTSLPGTATFFSHNGRPIGGENHYLVKAVKLQQSASGTYFNQSQGISTTKAVYAGISRQDKVMAGVRVYPNPATDIVQIAFSDFIAGTYQLQLRDALGRLAIDRSLKVVSGNFTESLNLESYSKGIYVVTVNGATSSFTQKLVLR